MGNRATIEIEDYEQHSLYLQWNGGKGSVRAFVQEALRRANVQEDQEIPDDFIFYLHATIRDYFNFADVPSERGRDRYSLYVYEGISATHEDNGHYFIRRQGTIDYSKVSPYLESAEETEELYQGITEFFKKFEDTLLEADAW